MNQNLASLLTASAAEHPDRPALRLGEAEITYAELDAASARVAGMLRERGVKPGDRVGIKLPNVPEFAMAYYGVLRMGGVVVPMNILLKPREMDFYVSDSGAVLVLDDPSVLPGDAEPDWTVAERSGDDTAVILYTSGTTGKPKGAELTHASLARNVEVMRGTHLLDLTPDDVVLGALPLFHAFGQTVGLNATLAAGATFVLLPRFSAEAALELITRHGVTIFEGVPTMFTALLHDAADEQPGSLRLTVSGGAALPVEVLHGFEAKFATTVLEGYGLSETSPVVSFNHADRERKAGSIGTPIEGVEMKLIDGEIAVRGHNVMKGYWNRPEATAEAIDADGWFHTGDIGRVDEDGYYFIVDRKKDMIIRGGYNVYPREIEEVLYEHPAVREAAVIGVPHPSLGEEVAAAVALKPGAEVSADELKAFVKGQVAAYKYPRTLWLVDELPKGPTGKILKREIRVPEGSVSR